MLTLTWWNRPSLKNYDGIICDGSIRSGKTISMSIGFILWSMSRFDGQKFAICGKTIESLRRNVITLLPNWLEGVFEVKERRGENMVIIKKGNTTNYYYLFGGKDEGSYALIQGMTLAGVLLDEVALMPRSFVEQALGRCSVSGSKFWFNCNPEHPMHWFYVEWIKNCRKKNMLFLHFTMADNYSLGDDVRRRYENMFKGVFYDRYILGEWVKAEGLVYPFFNEEKCCVDASGMQFDEYYVSCDYGTLNPCDMTLWGINYCNRQAVAVKEIYYDGRKTGVQKTDSEYYEMLVNLCDGFWVEDVVVDPSAASFIAEIRRHNRFNVRKAKNDVVDGIRVTGSMLKDGKVKIDKNCEGIITEAKLYSWDEKSNADRPLKSNDHAMDSMRYFCLTILNNLIL